MKLSHLFKFGNFVEKLAFWLDFIRKLVDSLVQLPGQNPLKGLVIDEKLKFLKIRRDLDEISPNLQELTFFISELNFEIED